MFGVTGAGSAIVRSLEGVTGERSMRINAGRPLPETHRFVLAQGVLTGKKIVEQTDVEIQTALGANLIGPVQLCETILAARPDARICVIGSASAWRGSYDEAYAISKAGLHAYIGFRRVGTDQQLVCVAPHIIADAGMTLRRKDYDACMARAAEQPKGRYITAEEVAWMVHALLWSDAGFVNNTVIRMDGGC